MPLIPSVDTLARALSRRNAEIRVPPTPTLVRVQATVTAVSTGSHTCSVTFGASTVVVPGVKYMPHYVPSVGDICWVDLNGGDPLVIGQHV